MTGPPIVIVGGVTAWPGSYRDFAGILSEVSGSEVHIARITPLDWLRGRLLGFGQLVFEIAGAVDRALIESEAKEAVLIGHSAGGVACRVYLGGDPPYGGRRYSGHRRVSHLITLGSPHNVPEIIAPSPISEVNALFPGALHESVNYLSVAGRAVNGSDSRRVRKRYERFAENGRADGDGVVPTEAALLPGSESVVLDGIFHNRRVGRWYGADPEAVERWWPDGMREGASLVAEPGA